MEEVSDQGSRMVEVSAQVTGLGPGLALPDSWKCRQIGGPAGPRILAASWRGSETVTSWPQGHVMPPISLWKYKYGGGSLILGTPLARLDQVQAVDSAAPTGRVTVTFSQFFRLAMCILLGLFHACYVHPPHYILKRPQLQWHKGHVSYAMMLWHCCS
jgi:hypothetical protein